MLDRWSRWLACAAMTLSPGDTGARLHAHRRLRRHRQPRGLHGPTRPALRLPRRHDARLHEGGLRLPRQPRRRSTGAGYAILGISPDKPEKLAKFREQEGLTYPLLSDPDKAVLTAYGAYGEKKLYGKVVTGVIRSTFVISPDGHDRARLPQREGHRARRQAHPRPRDRRSDDHRSQSSSTRRQSPPTARTAAASCVELFSADEVEVVRARDRAQPGRARSALRGGQPRRRSGPLRRGLLQLAAHRGVPADRVRVEGRRCRGDPDGAARSSGCTTTTCWSRSPEPGSPPRGTRTSRTTTSRAGTTCRCGCRSTRSPRSRPWSSSPARTAAAGSCRARSSPSRPQWFPEGTLEELPDIEADRDAYDIRGWALEPGDAVFFHMLTAHHAYGVPGPNRRRAFSLRFLGDDATHAPRPWRTSPQFDGLEDELPSGAPMDHSLFPVLREAPAQPAESSTHN